MQPASIRNSVAKRLMIAIPVSGGTFCFGVAVKLVDQNGVLRA